jgi:acyl-CoA synthetase (AMP-forming)/AMP-acid ligase II
MVARDDDQPGRDEEGLKSWVGQDLARYEVRGDVVFLDELPRNATGKILKHELAQQPAGRPARVELS